MGSAEGVDIVAVQIAEEHRGLLGHVYDEGPLAARLDLVPNVLDQHVVEVLDLDLDTDLGVLLSLLVRLLRLLLTEPAEVEDKWPDSTRGR